jgi:putative tryptophan/tyrosine transport system substrate-binding protein
MLKRLLTGATIQTLAWLAVIATLGACRSPADAQQPGGRRVGVLFIGAPITPEIEGLREGLREAGYVEGKNLHLEISRSKTYEDLKPAVEIFKNKRTDVIVSFGSTATNVARKTTREIPIIFVYGQDPVRQGFVKSMAHSGTNLTGLTIAPDFELQGKRLEIFKEAVPALKRVAVLYNGRADAPHHTMSLTAAHHAGKALGLKLFDRAAKSAADISSLLSSMSKENSDGIFTICAGMFREITREIAAHALKQRLPLMTCFAEGVAEDGGLLDYDTDRSGMGRRAAGYVDRILRGAKPSDLPVETPTYFELVINLKTAKQIGVTIPPNVLARADRVIR